MKYIFYDSTFKEGLAREEMKGEEFHFLTQDLKQMITFDSFQEAQKYRQKINWSGISIIRRERFEELIKK